MSEKNITTQINDLNNKFKNKNATIFLDLPGTGPVTFSEQSYNTLRNFLRANPFNNKDIMTPESFNYLQKILELGVIPNDRQSILINELAKNCGDYSDKQRSDLIPYIRPILFEKGDLRIECFINHLEKLNPLNLEQASKDKLEKFDTVISRSRTTSNMVAAKINKYPQILDALQRNPNFTGNLEKSFLTNINLSSKIRSNMSTTTNNANARQVDATRINNANAKNAATSRIVRGNTTSDQLITADAPSPTITNDNIISEIPRPPTSRTESERYTRKSTPITLSESAPNRADIDDILARINRHLQRLDTGQNITSSTPVRVLEIPDETGNIVASISIGCLLNYLSVDKGYPRLQNNDECTTAIRNYLNEGNTIDLRKLIDTALRDTNENDFITSTNFYKNLYNFNISMVSFMANDTEFKNLTADSQRNILQGVQDFISQSVQYLSSYMTTYRVINDDLLRSSYDLLYLMNTLTFKTASVGRTVDDLLILYDRLTTAIGDNIKIYNSIDKDKLKQYKDLEPTDQTAKEITKLYAELTSRLVLLNSQKEQLQKNVAMINTDSNKLEDLATKDVKDIASKIDTRRNLKTETGITTDQANLTNTITKTNNANVTQVTEKSPPANLPTDQSTDIVPGQSGTIGQNGGYLTGPTTGSTVPSTTNKLRQRRY
ncbi:hypothetical protein QJ857_gp0506 [Tupanvirus soda lake]|uniref:Uncharacterized protein n=2 Tax=Tupanvirus TaxID=2094720 RepID=A0A6N1NMA7_9VIRU|nr:hypothetical protein QJ857_gp0506 [Tupanvirus soda lake]QKU35535.1 hypothetical protein [Tupanvirus soda lake]